MSDASPPSPSPAHSANGAQAGRKRRARGTTVKSLTKAPGQVADNTSELPGPDELEALRTSPKRFLNRETSWLEFNRRVLEEAGNPRHPLFERVRFLAISGSNLDEFYMVRVAGLRAVVQSGGGGLSADGLTPSQQLTAVHALASELMAEQQRLWLVLQKELRAAGVFVLSDKEVTKKEREWLRDYYMQNLHPLLTPLMVDASHPFPFVPNLGFNLALQLRDASGRLSNALVRIPQGVGRFIPLPCEQKTEEGHAKKRTVMLETVLGMFLDILFPGVEVTGKGLFRIVRDSDIEYEEEAEDLVRHFRSLLEQRRRGVVVRLKIEASMPQALRDFVIDELEALAEDVLADEGVLGVNDLSQLITKDRSDLLFAAFEPRSPERLDENGGDAFAAIRAKDILLHHPYETFDTVVDFVRQAAVDPKVVAIKQTLYRTSQDSPIVAALCRASENGKNVTAVVELKARFDEEANIAFARRLERAGVQVVYGGFTEMKTHAKLSVVARREGDSLRVYTHVGTGNYHPQTARVYTDVSLFTANPAFGRDAVRVFNFITAYTPPQDLEEFAVSPFTMKSELLALIAKEMENAGKGKPAAIWAKMNALVDTEIIDALYEASQGGVSIDLIIRGVCCLRPQRPGLSDNIRVKSLVGRFLEHSRIWAFANGAPLPSDESRVYISSADWMPRNLRRRVEVMAPAHNKTVRRQILDQIMGANLRDERQSWLMDAEGAYSRHPRHDAEDAFCAHTYLAEHASLSGRGDALRAHGEPPALLWPNA